MQPKILSPIFAPTNSLPGVGPRTAELFKKLPAECIIDLAWHFPNGFVDRRNAPKIKNAKIGTIATILVTIEQHEKPYHPRQPHRVLCSDETGEIYIVFFRSKIEWLTKALPLGKKRFISGLVESYSKGGLQIIHPDYIVKEEESSLILINEPKYSLTIGLTPKTIRRSITAAISRLPDLDEWQDEKWRNQNDWPTWKDAIIKAHAPETESDLDPNAPWRRRLSYDELLANQLAINLVRAHSHLNSGFSTKTSQRLRKLIQPYIKFELTSAQKTAIAQIDKDMQSSSRMIRLLQGDVGSGKTIVAIYAMLNACEHNKQSAFMAPTEILARQHFETLSAILEPTEVKCELITGRQNRKERENSLSKLANGDVLVAVGTHALFQKSIEFKNLGLVVVDEQHRFGVQQRLALTRKASKPDILVMTATPIPRTLLLTEYGDMDISKLTGQPSGRGQVTTRAIPINRLKEVRIAVARAVENGSKVYWVCPLVEDSSDIDIAAAESRYNDLTNFIGDKVSIIHGRMKTDEKDMVIKRFKEGPLQVLVSTTVIEVGLDIPEATIMVIEHADRFGLSQLHQLRGRIGRGSSDSVCLLLYRSPLSLTARGRLDIMRKTNDGFLIAEHDLKLRGSGEILGTRQSGMPKLRIANISIHEDLLKAAHNEARVITESGDLHTQSLRSKALRVLLHLFQRNTAVQFLKSG